MKKLIFIITIMVSYQLMSQEKFIYTTNGLAPKFIVNTIDSLSQKKLYNKTMNWIKTAYKNPKEVIKSTIENEMIRFTGIKERVLTINKIDFDCRYTIAIHFKDGRYRFKPINIDVKASDYNQDWINFSLTEGKPYFNKKGGSHKKFQPYTTELPRLLNSINSKLINSINSKQEEW